MPGIDKPSGRVVALVVLLIAAAASLRGYLPGIERAPRGESTAGPVAMVFLVVLLGVSIGIVAMALIVRLRDPRTAARGSGGLPEGLGGGGRPSWRVVLIGLGVLVAWLLIGWLLAGLPGRHGIGQLPSGPETPGNGTAPPPHAPPHSSGDVLGYLGASTAALLLVLTAAIVVTARRRRVAQSPIVPGDSATPGARSESLARAAELGLAEIGDLRREPRAAIIACYATMEGELANVPGAVPQDFDTPTEVLVRAVEHHALPADNATQLVNLFEEARFSRHVMTEGHRDIAVHVLRLVLAELRNPA